MHTLLHFTNEDQSGVHLTLRLLGPVTRFSCSISARNIGLGCWYETKRQCRLNMHIIPYSDHMLQAGTDSILCSADSPYMSCMSLCMDITQGATSTNNYTCLPVAHGLGVSL
jgi:hypothetical protein